MARNSSSTSSSLWQRKLTSMPSSLWMTLRSRIRHPCSRLSSTTAPPTSCRLQTKAEIVRCVLQSLAAKYAEATAHLNEMLPQPIKCMHIIGGGSQNKLLNRLTSEALGVPVIASYRGYGYGQHPDPGTCQGRNQGYRRAESCGKTKHLIHLNIYPTNINADNINLKYNQKRKNQS